MLGEPRLEKLIHHAAEAVGAWLPPAAGLLTWLTQAGISGTLGLAIGDLCAPLAHHILEPAAEWLTAKYRARRA